MDFLTDELIKSIRRIVSSVGGHMDSVERTAWGTTLVMLSGMPEGPLTERQERAVRELEKVGIICGMNLEKKEQN